ncbi:MAG TPA: hypothetical protein VL401_01015 [Alphaproteobacteria bacterium]|jgi:hypothetical protein|nr:hypothetical protein [Alphaproteobacteria bacterium]
MNPKQTAQKIARQLAQEPLEILKEAREQVTGENVEPQNRKTEEPDQQKQIQHQQELQDKMRASRRIEAYQRELEDIRKQDVFKDLQRRISEGEEVPLNDYAELTMEQKQVLQAQMEAVKAQESGMRNAESGLMIPGSKRSRRMGGQKQEAEKQQTRVEKPVPPSG